METVSINKSDIEALMYFIYTWTDEDASGGIQINREIPSDEFISFIEKIKYTALIQDDMIMYTDMFELFTSIKNELKLDINALVIKFMVVGDYLKLWTFIDPNTHGLLSKGFIMRPYIEHFKPSGTLGD